MHIGRNMILLICQERRDSEFRLSQRKCDVMCTDVRKKNVIRFRTDARTTHETYLGMKFTPTTFPTKEKCVANDEEID